MLSFLVRTECVILDLAGHGVRVSVTIRDAMQCENKK